MPGRQFPIYKAEADIAPQIIASASFAYTTALEVAEIFKPDEKIMEAIANEGGKAEDLFYMKAVLATVGWNKNDDVFDRVETWLARDTPEDKPFNIEHDPRRVRGHITGCYVVDAKNKIISPATAIDDVPDQYSVVTSSVLYKFMKCGDEELEKEAAKTIAEIQKGEWYVSMEALFTDFDYGIVDKDGTNRVIARNEKSSFLTKKLRAYGGDGIYDNCKIGRVLKNMFFTGKGLVKKPANASSIIFDTVANFLPIIEKNPQVINDVGYTSIENVNAKENIIMPDVNVANLEAENKRLENTVATLTAQAKEVEKRLADMNEKAVTDKLNAAAADIKVRDEKITSLQTQVTAEQKARQEAEAKIVETDKKNAELSAEIAKANEAKVKANRVSTIVSDLGKVQADAEKFYDENVADLNMSDERFVKFVATLKAEKPAVATPTKVDTTATAAAVIEAAKPTENGKPAALGTETINESVEQTRAGLSSYLSNAFLHGKRTGNASK